MPKNRWRKCCVSNCSSEKNISYHYFPKNKELDNKLCHNCDTEAASPKIQDLSIEYFGLIMLLIHNWTRVFVCSPLFHPFSSSSQKPYKWSKTRSGCSKIIAWSFHTNIIYIYDIICTGCFNILDLIDLHFSHLG